MITSSNIDKIIDKIKVWLSLDHNIQNYTVLVLIMLATI